MHINTISRLKPTSIDLPDPPSLKVENYTLPIVGLFFATHMTTNGLDLNIIYFLQKTGKNDKEGSSCTEHYGPPFNFPDNLYNLFLLKWPSLRSRGFFKGA